MKKIGAALFVFMLFIIMLTGCINDKEPDAKEESEENIENLTVSTDKVSYNLGETVNISIKNNLNTSLVIITPVYYVQKFNNTDWIFLRETAYPCESSCMMGMIAPNITINPNQTLKYQWDQKERWCVSSDSSPCYLKTETINATSGLYRLQCTLEDNENHNLFYSNNFTIESNEDISLNFSFSECGVFSFDESDTGINETIWIDNTTLNVKANVLINCGEEIINGSYQLVDDKITLYYNSPECVEECMDCMCGVVLYYNFTNLDKKDYQFELERIV